MTDPRDDLTVTRRRELLDAALGLADLCAETTAAIVSAGFEVSRKADASLVTTADVETERRFRTRVEELFPEMGILGEELGDGNAAADFRWVIDPIDGTAEFARHLPVYGCIIGLHYKTLPVIGVIDHRALGVRCHAAYGLGAFANGERLALEDWPPDGASAGARLGLPSRASFLSPRDCSAVFDAIVREFPNFRAYHTCYAHTLAATGGLDAAMEWDTPLWDLAASRILIEEAGGAYHALGTIQVPGRGRFHSAVFGKRALVERLAETVAGVLDAAH